MLGWLTPDSLPAAERCVQIRVPTDPDFFAMLMGALVPLYSSSNYEKHGALTPEEVAQFWVDWTFDNAWLDCEECNEMVPIGTIVLWTCETLPVEGGWLWCDGEERLIVNHQLLYAQVGTAFGGDGVDTFAVPDFRGRMPIGTGTGDGLTERLLADQIGAETVTLDEAELPAHDHALTNTGWLQTNASGGSGQTLLRQTSGSINTANAGNGQAHPNMPPAIALGFIIYAGFDPEPPV